jgi:hypothetical protein
VAPLALFLPISHAFQPLDVACFQPFKKTFKKENDDVMVENNYIESNKNNPSKVGKQKPWTKHWLRKM